MENSTQLAEAGVPRVGSLARVRQRLYLVEDVRPPVEPGDSPLVSLACVEDDAQGQTLEVLWDIEPDARAYEADRWHGLGKRDFDDPALFAAYVNTLRWNCVTATDATLLQSPFRAGIRIEDYQLEPLRKALRLPRVNLFIAMEGGRGWGKTAWPTNVARSATDCWSAPHPTRGCRSRSE